MAALKEPYIHSVLYLIPFHITAVPEDKSQRQWDQLWGSSVDVDCGFSFLFFFGICPGHLGKATEKCASICARCLTKDKCLWAISARWMSFKPSRVWIFLGKISSKFNYILQAAWQFPLCKAQFNKTVPNCPGNLETVWRDSRQGPSTRGPLNYSIMVTHTCRYRRHLRPRVEQLEATN